MNATIPLNEDDFGGLGGMGMGGGGYGHEFVNREQLYDIFVQPFVNAFQHGVGKTKELTRKGATVLKVAFETIATTLIPALKDSYDDIFAEEKADIERVRSEYGRYYQATWDAFHNDDVVVAAFMYAPHAFLTVKLAQSAPKLVANVLSVLSGGKLDNALMKIMRSKGSTFGRISGGGHGGGSGGGMGAFGYDGAFGENVLREAEESVDPLIGLIKNAKVKKLIRGSERSSELRQVGRKIVESTLRDVIKEASSVLGARSFDDLQRAVSTVHRIKVLPGTERLRGLKDNERRAAEAKLIDAIKRSSKEFYVRMLTSRVQHAIDAGVPEDHPYIAVYNKAIAKIKSM